ncbi:MAG: CocE/NonD family hydrolase [Candidatus Promineifilaceae bacterium]|nr:CocE/NonD family hydrolase [Candidatus Promineifilaceae bacterium]
MERRLRTAGAVEMTAERPEAPADVEFQWGVKIPLRDGVRLNATLYRPQADEPTPAIFTLTPYIADSYHERAYYFARNGYAFLLVDCRGRGNSEGEFEPMANEGPDGHDVVEWLAAQPWCNGSVTMWGGSYAGYNQWMTLKEFPPHLETIVPAASAHPGVDFPFFKNIFYPYIMQWLTFTSGVTPNANLFGERHFWIAKFRELYLNHRPFNELDRVVGNTSTHFQTWIAHPTPDAYWDQMTLSPEVYDRIDAPILTITGHYDGDQPGAMRFYRQHVQSASPARDDHYLIVGPWDHAGTRTPEREVGGVTFAEASLLDLNELHKEWYDWTLKGGSKPEFLKDRVAYYVMGAEEWKYAPSLEAISGEMRRLYLNSTDGRANDAFHSGTLQEQVPEKSPPDQYVYDPLDVRPAELEQEEVKAYLTDQRYALNLFGNGLVYHSAPFTEEVEITGFLTFVAWIALDAPDTDFQVDVYEILRDGSSIHLTTDMLRARYRESLREARLVTSGEINRYEFDTFTFFSRRVAKRSRLRLVIRSPNTIHLQKNYNSGGVVADESGEEAQPVRVTLYHDSERPSFLELPVVS